MTASQATEAGGGGVKWTYMVRGCAFMPKLLGRQAFLELVGDEPADQVLFSLNDGASLAGLALKLGGLLGHGAARERERERESSRSV